MTEPLKVNTWYEMPAPSKDGYSVDIEAVKEQDGIDVCVWRKTVTVPPIEGIKIRQSVWRK